MDEIGDLVLLEVAETFIIHFPAMLVCVVGMIVCLFYFNKARKAAVLGAVGFALLLGARGAIFASNFIAERNEAFGGMTTGLRVFFMLAQLQHAIGLVCLLLAIISGRKQGS